MLKMAAGTQERSGTVQLEAGRLFYVMKGQGEPIVFLHGAFADHRSWDAQMDAFAGKYTVVSYDQRGYGQSAAQPASFFAFEDLSRLIDALQLGRVTLVGSSLGAAAAIDYTLACPAKVKSLILSAPCLGGYRSSLKQTLEELRSLRLIREAGRAAAIERLIANPYWEAFLPPPGREEARRRTLAMLRDERNFYRLHPRLNRPRKPYAARLLRNIKAPTLVITADGDSAFNLRRADYIYERIVQSRRAVIIDSGHMPFLEKPVEFNQMVSHFLNEVKIFGLA